MNMFDVGSYVVYPTHGVGRVMALEAVEIAGSSLDLFVIFFQQDRMTLKVPVPKACASGLRKISTRQVMDDALAILKGKAKVKRTMWSRRAQEYEAKINSGDPLSIAEVVRDLYRNPAHSDQSFSERQIYEMARDRLACESAALESLDTQHAMEKLEALLQAA